MSSKQVFSVFLAMSAVLLLTAHGQTTSFPTPYSCLNPAGKTVEWYISLKMPNGYNYIYMDSENQDDWQLPTDGIDHPKSPLMRTLATVQNIYNQEGKQREHEAHPSKFGSIFWNDQPPGTTASKDSKAHSKGVMGFDEHAGFLLIHSTPRFPTISGVHGREDDQTVDDTLSQNQTIYGQHFFCITAETVELEKIAQAYLVDDVYVYAGSIPNDMKSKFPNLNSILVNKYQRLKDTGIKFDFLSLNHNFHFTIFGKSLSYVAPFYESVVVPAMGSGIRTETWGNGVSKLEDPTCKGLGDSVVSNLEVNVKGKYVYKSSNDHSKYGISMDPNNPFVCLGDINRQASQYKRGGGSVCIVNQQIWKNFNDIMVKSQDCSSVDNLKTAVEQVEGNWTSQVQELLFGNKKSGMKQI